MPVQNALLVGYYEGFLRDQDAARFRERVAARYSEGTLARLLRMGEVEARRAAAYSLGQIGTFQVNDEVARALRDPDPTVRGLASEALWLIWFRADAPENNATLARVRSLNDGRRFEEAAMMASRLIARSPRFAEAYNQRAIAYYLLGRLEESANDCLRALERNPHHFGALSGLGQCYLGLDRPGEALKVFRKALKLQPYSEGLRETVAILEAGGP